MKSMKKHYLAVLAFLLLSLTVPVLSGAASPKPNAQRLLLYVGNSVQLKLNGVSKKGAWHSSKKSVVTVNRRGIVTAKKRGFAVITAKSGKKSYRLKAVVKNPGLNKTRLSLKKGRSYTLRLAGASVKSFKSSNPRVAAVSKTGKITAKKSGTATIICRGSNNKTYRCKVTVKKNTSAAGSVSRPLTQARVYSDISALKTRYPEGKRWTNANSYAWKGGIYDIGFGCSAFAFRLSDAAFGSLPARMHKSFSNLKVGDILRLDYNTHSVIVLERQSDGVIVAEGNYNDSIHWGRKIPYSEIRRTGTYVLTRYPKNLPFPMELLSDTSQNTGVSDFLYRKGGKTAPSKALKKQSPCLSLGLYKSKILVKSCRSGIE